VSAVPDLLLLYDGDCGFCDRSVQWVLDRDVEQRFSFAPLQGDTAAELRARHAVIPNDLDSMVLVRVRDQEERIFLRSAAVLRVAAELPGLWRCFGVLLVLPAWLMDLLYRPVALLRYRLFGRVDQCRRVLPAEAHRFLP
jgi:predicted DCC family thiol-disulfide oxidoreductase YuxK